MNPNVLVPNASEGTGVYIGVVDGTTRYGEVIKGGPTKLSQRGTDSAGAIW